MRYIAIKENDIANGPGVNVSFWVSGCPHHCKGCFNSETWDYNTGKDFTRDTLNEIFEALTANGVQRGFSLLGGEPLCPSNLNLSTLVIHEVRKKFPDIKINVWTGYLYEDIIKSKRITEDILPYIDMLVDGPFIEEEKDLTLKWRGSRNQKIYYFEKHKKF